MGSRCFTISIHQVWHPSLWARTIVSFSLFMRFTHRHSRRNFFHPPSDWYAFVKPTTSFSHTHSITPAWVVQVSMLRSRAPDVAQTFFSGVCFVCLPFATNPTTTHHHGSPPPPNRLRPPQFYFPHRNSPTLNTPRLPMATLRTGPSSSPQKRTPELAPTAADHLPISREVGVVEPPHQLRAGDPKPWAHFVAGACVFLLTPPRQ